MAKLPVTAVFKKYLYANQQHRISQVLNPTTPVVTWNREEEKQPRMPRSAFSITPCAVAVGRLKRTHAAEALQPGMPPLQAGISPPGRAPKTP
jgi:hypothetical protein